MSSCVKRRWKVDTTSIGGGVKNSGSSSEFDAKLAQLKAARAGVDTMWVSSTASMASTTHTNSETKYLQPSSGISTTHQHSPWS